MTTPIPDEDPLRTPGEVADAFRVSEGQVYRWIKRGLIASEPTPEGFHRVRQSLVTELLQQP